MAPPKKWDESESESEEESGHPIAVALASKKKWDDEESDDDVVDSWDAADDSEEERKKATKAQLAAEKAAAAALANKTTSSERIAEKKSLAAAKKAEEDALAFELENETPAERRARVQAREVAADLAHAEDLFASVGISAGSGTSGRGNKPVAIVDPGDSTKVIDISTLSLFKPVTKANFDLLRETLVPLLAAHTKKPHYNSFLQEFTRALAKEMPSEQIKLVASKLTTLANEKQKEEKDAAKGGKKKGAAAAKKVGLANSGKDMDRVDTRTYDDNYYDDDDFM